MKRVLLSILAVAAAGGLASAQTSGVQDVSTNVSVLNTLTVNNSSVVLTLNSADTSTVLSYSTNDGGAHSITTSATEWTTTATNTSFYPILSANGSQLISGGNVPASAVTLQSGITNSTDTLGVTLLAASGSDVLEAGAYATVVTYTLN